MKQAKNHIINANDFKTLPKISDFPTANAMENKTYSVEKCHSPLLFHNGI